MKRAVLQYAAAVRNHPAGLYSIETTGKSKLRECQRHNYALSEELRAFFMHENGTLQYYFGKESA